MEYKYNKTKENVKEIINDEIKSHKKYDIYNEIKGKIEEDKVTLYVESDVPATLNTYFKNYFVGTISQENDETILKGRFSMKIYKIVLLVILFLVCLEVIIYNVTVSNPVTNIIPAIIILAAEIGLIVFQEIASRKEKKTINSFLSRL